jgi:hypothetical protein
LSTGGECVRVLDGTRTAEKFAAEGCASKAEGLAWQARQLYHKEPPAAVWCIPTDFAYCFTYASATTEHQFCYGSAQACAEETSVPGAPHKCSTYFDGSDR